MKSKQNKLKHVCRNRDLFQKIDTFIECYGQYIDHFKSGFPYVSSQSFNEGPINVRTTNDTSDQAYNQRGVERGLPCPFSKIGKNMYFVAIYGLSF